MFLKRVFYISFIFVIAVFLSGVFITPYAKPTNPMQIQEYKNSIKQEHKENFQKKLLFLQIQNRMQLTNQILSLAAIKSSSPFFPINMQTDNNIPYIQNAQFIPSEQDTLNTQSDYEELSVEDLKDIRDMTDNTMTRVMKDVHLEWQNNIDRQMQIIEMQNSWSVAKKAADAARVN